MRPDVSGRALALCPVAPPSPRKPTPPHPPAPPLSASTGLKSTSCGVMPVVAGANEAPLSALRHNPVFVAASRTPPDGAIARRFTAVDWLAVRPTGFHVAPPSTLLKMPAPRSASALP